MKRALSGDERILLQLSRRRMLGGFLHMHFRGRLDATTIPRALERLQRRHPLLRARVVREHGTYSFTDGAPPIPHEVLTTHGDRDLWRTVAAAEHLRPFELSRGPLARFIVILDSGGKWVDLILIMDHLVTDGVSGMTIMSDFLRYVEDPSLPVDPRPLVPSLSELLLDLTLDAEASPGAPGVTDLDTATASIPDTPNVLVEDAQLESMHMAALARRCREHEVSVSSAIFAAVALVLRSHEPESSRVVLQIPVDLRSHLADVTREAVGFYIGLATLSLDMLTPSSFWSHARAVQQELVERTSKEELVASIAEIEALSRDEPDDDSFLQRAFLGSVHHDISVSNHGRVSLAPYQGELELESIGGGIGGPGQLVLSTFTIRDTMFLSLYARDLDADAKDQARRVPTAIRGLLVEAASLR